MTQTDVYVYSLPDCPRCEILKTTLTGSGIQFATYDMSEAATITELRLEGCFAMEAPVLAVVTWDFTEEKNYNFFYGEDLFENDVICEDALAAARKSLNHD
jgi:hypothetical protein